jgi:nicotinate-nucleotide--dimethylbenzimidazole phosphoribosyltransferase
MPLPFDLPFDAVVFDIGGTLVREAPAGTAVADLTVRYLDGAPRTLAALRRAGLRIGAVTDTSVMTEPDVRALLAAGGVSDLIEALVTSVDVGAAKPDPAGIRVVLDRLGLTDGSRVLFVGDREVDAEAALAAGCAFTAVGPYADTGSTDRTADPTGEGAGVRTPLHERLRRAFLAAGASPAAAAAVVIGPVDTEAGDAADARQLQLTKPPGSLGRLEVLARQLAEIAGEVPPPVPEPAALAVFAGDHGVLDEGVTPWPREVTAQMIANVAAGGAASSVLARRFGVRVVVTDVGVATPWPTDAAVIDENIARGTANLAVGPALTEAQVRDAIDVGARRAAALVADGARALVTGDMGIGNTTPSAALIALLTGRPAAEVTGRGTGIDDPTLARKIAVIERAVARARGDEAAEGVDGVRALAEVGGLEHAALVGLILGGAAARVPVVVDGVIALAALLVAHRIHPDVLGVTVAGHRSAEPGASIVLAELGLDPVIDLGLRLGEGSGALLAVPVLAAAADLLADMATFDAAGVTDKDA